jgi:hypothetical protein
MISRLIILLILASVVSCEDPEELITNSFIGQYQNTGISITYNGLDMLDKTPLASDYPDYSFSLFDDFSFKVDTAFIDYFFFLRPGIAFTGASYIGVWSLLDRDEVVPPGIEFISLNLDRYYFLITRMQSGQIRLSSTSNSPLMQTNIQVNFFRKIGEDYGNLTFEAIKLGQSMEEATILGERLGYYEGYHKTYEELTSLNVDVAMDPIDVYASSFLLAVDTAENPNSDFMHAFLEAVPTGILAGTEDATTLFTIEAKSLDLDFNFLRIE